MFCSKVSFVEDLLITNCQSSYILWSKLQIFMLVLCILLILWIGLVTIWMIYETPLDCPFMLRLLDIREFELSYFQCYKFLNEHDFNGIISVSRSFFLDVLFILIDVRQTMSRILVNTALLLKCCRR